VVPSIRLRQTNDRDCGELRGMQSLNEFRVGYSIHMIVIGLVLLLLGLVLSSAILQTAGIILAIVGLVLMLMGRTGRAIGGRSHYW